LRCVDRRWRAGRAATGEPSRKQGAQQTADRKNFRTTSQIDGIGITPPSLELFQNLGLVGDFVSRGVRVDHAKVHEGNKLAGELSFHSLKHAFPFILSIPQATTIEILEQRLRREPLVEIRRETSLLNVEQTDEQVIATVQ